MGGMDDAIQEWRSHATYIFEWKNRPNHKENWDKMTPLSLVVERTQKYGTSYKTNFEPLEARLASSPKIRTSDYRKALISNRVRLQLGRISIKSNFEPSEPWDFLPKLNTDRVRFITNYRYLKKYKNRNFYFLTGWNVFFKIKLILMEKTCFDWRYLPAIFNILIVGKFKTPISCLIKIGAPTIKVRATF